MTAVGRPPGHAGTGPQPPSESHQPGCLASSPSLASLTVTDITVTALEPPLPLCQPDSLLRVPPSRIRYWLNDMPNRVNTTGQFDNYSYPNVKLP